MRFWDVVKEVSAQTIRKEAERIFVLGLAGNPESVAQARALVFGPLVPPHETARVEPYLCCASPPYNTDVEKRLRHADLLVSLPGGPGLTEFRPADTLQAHRLDDLLERILTHRPDLRLALARRLPGFREPAAQMVIREVSRVNAEYSALTGLSQSVPFLMPLLPVVLGADTVVLTKNQLMMIFRLAAIYGEDMSVQGRVKEVLGVVGGALGWRTLARQVVGALPGALGVPFRAGIAYSGTYAAGRAAQMVFDEGRRPTRAEMVRIYEEGADLARDAVTHMKDRFRRKAENGAPKALPETTDPPGEPIPAEFVDDEFPVEGR